MGGYSDEAVDIATIITGVRRIVSEEIGVELHRITPDTDVVSDLNSDKSDMGTIKTAVEQKFLIKISDENWEKMLSVRDIAHLVEVYLEIKQIEM